MPTLDIARSGPGDEASRLWRRPLTGTSRSTTTRTPDTNMSAGPLETAADRARKWAKEQAASAAAADAAAAALAPPKGAKVVHLPPEDKGYWFAAGIVMTHTFPLVFCAMMWGLHDGKSCNRDLSTYLLAQALFSMMHIGVCVALIYILYIYMHTPPARLRLTSPSRTLRRYAPTYLMMFQDYGDVRDTLSLVPNTGLYYFTSTQIYLELAWTCMGVVWTAEAIACQVDLRRAAFWTSVYMLVVGNTGNFFFHIVVPCWLHNYHGAHGADPTIAVAKPFDKPKGPAEAGVGDFFTLKDNVRWAGASLARSPPLTPPHIRTGQAVGRAGRAGRGHRPAVEGHHGAHR